MLTVGAFAVQTAILMVVLTLVDVPLLPVWVTASAAVAVVAFVPVVLPVSAVTVIVDVVDAPAASVTELGLKLDAAKSVLLLSPAVRLKVELPHAAVSVFVIVQVYADVPAFIVIVPLEGVQLTVGAFAVQTAPSV
jgi:hypothetical protein